MNYKFRLSFLHQRHYEECSDEVICTQLKREIASLRSQ